MHLPDSHRKWLLNLVMLDLKLTLKKVRRIQRKHKHEQNWNKNNSWADKAAYKVTSKYVLIQYHRNFTLDPCFANEIMNLNSADVFIIRKRNWTKLPFGWGNVTFTSSISAIYIIIFKRYLVGSTKIPIIISNHRKILAGFIQATIQLSDSLISNYYSKFPWIVVLWWDCLPLE